jgi:hypothetical protein
MRRRVRKGIDGEQQLKTLMLLAEVTAEELSVEQRETVFVIAAEPATPEVQLRAAILLSKAYPTLAPVDPDFARRTHTILLRDLHEPHKTLAHPSCSWLVMTHLREENLAHIPWQSPQEVASAAECFYGFCDGGLSAEEGHRRVRDLVKYAGLHFIRQGRYEDVFQLLTRVPVPSTMMDAELFQLRNFVVLYEQRRVSRFRRSLLGILAFFLVFILLLSPLLFMGCENHYRRSPEGEGQGLKEVDYFEAVYWSVVTATTLGYGDIVPHTALGKLLAICDSLFGMTLLGIIAGVILSYGSPRPLP